MTPQTIAITHSPAYIILTWSGGNDVKRIPKRNLTIIYHNESNIDKVYLNWPAGAYGQKKDHMSLDYTQISSPAVASNAALAILLQVYVDDQDAGGLALSASVLIGKSLAATEEDFVVTFTTAQTLTFSSYPTGITAITATDIEVVRQIDATGDVVETFFRQDTPMTMAGAVLTIAAATFTNTDTFVVYTNIPRDIMVVTETVLASIDADQDDIKDATRRSVGHWGSDTYGDTLTHTGAWYAFRVVEEATLAAITDIPPSGPVSTIPLATAIPAGAYISATGRFTSVTLDDGMITLYRILLFTTTTSTTTSTTSTTTSGEGGGAEPL